MNVYDSVIKETRELLSSYRARELPVSKGKPWPLLKENEFLLQRDVAYELGIRTRPGVCYNAVTSDSKLLEQDRILLYGRDLPEIKNDTVFSRITFLHIDPIEDPNKAYQTVRRLDFTRFKVIPKGYMILSSSMENRENIRVSKKALKNGLDFTTIGNLFIDHYKKATRVNRAEIIFITEELNAIGQLEKVARKVEEITDAFDHILKGLVSDCDLCPLHPICDEVDELRQLHFLNRLP